MAPQVLACEPAEPASISLQGSSQPSHSMQWNLEVSEPTVGAMALFLAQRVDPPLVRVPFRGEIFDYLGFRDEGAQALDINCEPQGGSNTKFTVRVTWRTPDAGQRESQQDLLFFDYLRRLADNEPETPPFDDFTTIEQLITHDSLHPLERWISYRSYTTNEVRAFRVDNPGEVDEIIDNQVSLISNVVGDPMPRGQWERQSQEISLIVERFVASPISCMWLNDYFNDTANAEPFELEYQTRSVRYNQEEGKYVRSATGRVQTSSLQPYYRCRTEIQLQRHGPENLNRLNRMEFAQYGYRYKVGSFPDPWEWTRADDDAGQGMSEVPLTVDGFKATPGAGDLAPAAVYAKARLQDNYQALIGPKFIPDPPRPPGT